MGAKWFNIGKQVTDPFDLAFFYSQEIDIKRKSFLKVIFKTIFGLQIFVARSFRKARYKKRTFDKIQFLFYAESANQFNTLFPIFLKMKKSEMSATFVFPEDRASEINFNDNIIYISSHFIDSILGIGAALKAFLSIRRRLLLLQGDLENLNYVLEPYRLMPLFHRILEQTDPGIMILSNDHTTACRTFNHMARNREIETVYMQHAQVGLHFPPLCFDHALLDGLHAAKIYSEIATRNGKGLPHIYLTGEKKSIRISARLNRSIGVGINTLDGLGPINGLLYALLGATDRPIVCRLHPAMSQIFKKDLKKSFKDCDRVEFFGASEQSLKDFLEDISLLIAGSTSLHLDALLNHIPSFFVDLRDNGQHERFRDAYGLVSGKLIPDLSDNMHDLENSILENNFFFNHKAIRSFSATYSTPWDGREFDLAIRVLQSIARKDNSLIDQLFPCKKNLSAGVKCYSIY